MVHRRVLAAAPYRTSGARDVLVGLAALGLVAGGIGALLVAGLAVAAVAPPLAFVLASLYTTGATLAAQALFLSTFPVGLVLVVVALSRASR